MSISPIEIHTRRLSIACGGRVLSTRSKALVVFACCLVRRQGAQPGAPWVGIEELRASLPSVHAKQMQRFVDALATIGFPIKYESKTHGRYRLTAPLERVRFDVDDSALDEFIGLPDKPLLAKSTGRGKQKTATFLDESDSLYTSLSRLNLADLQYHDGNLDQGSDHAFEIWRREMEKAPPGLRAIAMLKFAWVCRRLQRYGETQTALRRLQKMARNGEIAGNSLELRGQLWLAMLRYDQGRVAEGRAIVGKLDIGNCNDDCTMGEYYNLMGLFTDHDLRTGAELESAAFNALLMRGAGYFSQAVMRMARINDYQTMQRICLNLGNLYLHAYRAQIPVPQRERLLDQGLRWVIQCKNICNKFGVGMSSVRSDIVLVRGALDGALKLDALNRLSEDMFKNFVDLEHLTQNTLRGSIRIGNQLEQAGALGLLAKLAERKGDESGAENYRQQAKEIFRKLNRPDLVRQLKLDCSEL